MFGTFKFYTGKFLAGLKATQMQENCICIVWMHFNLQIQFKNIYKCHKITAFTLQIF